MKVVLFEMVLFKIPQVGFIKLTYLLRVYRLIGWYKLIHIYVYNCTYAYPGYKNKKSSPPNL